MKIRTVLSIARLGLIATIVAAWAAYFSGCCQGQEPAVSAEQRSTVFIDVRMPRNARGMTERRFASGVAVVESGREFVATTAHQFQGVSRESASTLDVSVGVLDQKAGNSGSWYPAKLRAFNHEQDIAVLEVPGVDLEAVEIGDYQPGSQVAQYGWSGRLIQIPRIGNVISQTLWGKAPALVVDRPAIPGDSGAGLFQNGRVIGVVAGTDMPPNGSPGHGGRSFVVRSGVVRAIISTVLNPLQVEPRYTIRGGSH